MNSRSTLIRLRLAHLLLGMMFFYGIEQLFLNHYLHNSSSRGYVTIIYTLGLVLFDIPTGILADRIGRKICLIFACIFQIISLLVLATSSNIAVYLIGSLLFSLYICFLNGAAQALLYDTLANEGKTSLYAKYQGSIYGWWLIGAGVANAISGFIAHFYGLRSAYFASIVPSFLALVVIYKIAEPPLVKRQAAIWYNHMNEVISEIRRHRRIMTYGLQFMASGIVLLTIGEFGQIYMLSFGISAILLGVYWAIDALFAASGRFAGHYLQKYPRLTVVVCCASLASFCLTHQAIGIAVFWLVYGLNEALANLSETEVQHETSSHIRATTFSVISFAGNLLSIPVLFVYNAIYAHHGIFKANQLIAVTVTLVLLGTLTIRLGARRNGDIGTTATSPV